MVEFAGRLCSEAHHEQSVIMAQQHAVLQRRANAVQLLGKITSKTATHGGNAASNVSTPPPPPPPPPSSRGIGWGLQSPRGGDFAVHVTAYAEKNVLFYAQTALLFLCKLGCMHPAVGI